MGVEGDSWGSSGSVTECTIGRAFSGSTFDLVLGEPRLVRAEGCMLLLGREGRRGAKS